MQEKLPQKEQFKKKAEAAGDLIGNKIDDKITSVSKKSPRQLLSKELLSNEVNNEIPKKRYISPQKKTTNY